MELTGIVSGLVDFVLIVSTRVLMMMVLVVVLVPILCTNVKVLTINHTTIEPTCVFGCVPGGFVGISSGMLVVMFVMMLMGID